MKAVLMSGQIVELMCSEMKKKLMLLLCVVYSHYKKFNISNMTL